MRTQSLVDDQGGLSSRLSLILTAFILAWLAGGICLGQGSTGVVEARVVTATEAAHPGTSVKVAVVAEIAPGFHINDHKPTLDYLIPTELKLDRKSTRLNSSHLVISYAVFCLKKKKKYKKNNTVARNK